MMKDDRDYDENKAIADQFIPEIKHIIEDITLRHAVIRISTDEEDRYRATDLVVEHISGNFALRVRNSKYLKYGDIAIRSKSAYRYTKETELQKLKKGYARWYLCMWVDDNNKIVKWICWDIKKAIEYGILDRKTEKRCKDGSWIITIPIDLLRAHDCIAKEGP